MCLQTGQKWTTTAQTSSIELNIYNGSEKNHQMRRAGRGSFLCLIMYVRIAAAQTLRHPKVVNPRRKPAWAVMILWCQGRFCVTAWRYTKWTFYCFSSSDQMHSSTDHFHGLVPAPKLNPGLDRYAACVLFFFSCRMLKKWQTARKEDGHLGSFVCRGNTGSDIEIKTYWLDVVIIPNHREKQPFEL